MVICRQSPLNIAATHDEEGKAIGQASVLAGAVSEQTQRAHAQFLAEGNHLNSRIKANSFVPVRGYSARSGARHSVHPLPANGFGGDQKRSGPNNIVLPRTG